MSEQHPFKLQQRFCNLQTAIMPKTIFSERCFGSWSQELMLACQCKTGRLVSTIEPEKKAEVRKILVQPIVYDQQGVYNQQG